MRSFPWRTCIPPVLLAAACAIVYAGILDHQFLVNWDDDRYITGNPFARGFSRENLMAAFTRSFVGNYAPVQILSYQLDYTLWGDSPAGYFLVNILLHLGAGILLWRLVLRLGGSAAGALAAGALFLVHPVQVETVAWASQRKTLLAVFFLLAALHLWRDWRERGGSGRYAASLGCFLLALLSKPLAVVLPPLLLLGELVFPPGGAAGAGDQGRNSGGAGRPAIPLRPLAPFFLAAVVVAAVALRTQEGAAGGGRVPWHGGSPWGTFCTMLPVCLRYLEAIAWPGGLSVFYDVPVRAGMDGTAAGALLVLAAAAAGGVFLARRDPPAGFWLGFALLAFLPTAQIVPLTTLMNDRYLYLPMAGVAGFAGWLVSRCRSRLPGWRRLAPAALLLAAVLPLGTAARARTGAWSDSVTLWEDAVAGSPGSGTPWHGLGDAHFFAGNYQQALDCYLQAGRMDPDDLGIMVMTGRAYDRMGHPLWGEPLLREAARRSPADSEARMFLAELLIHGGKTAEAEEILREARNHAPGNPRILRREALLSLQRNETEKAGELLALAGRSPERDPCLPMELAALSVRRGAAADAVLQLRQARRGGCREMGGLSSDAAFAPLRGLPEFQGLLREISVTTGRKSAQ